MKIIASICYIICLNERHFGSDVMLLWWFDDIVELLIYITFLMDEFLINITFLDHIA